MSSKIKGKGKGKKIPVGDHTNNDDRKPAEVYHDFWKKVPEDLLLEIFLRLPHFRSAVRCSTVCRLWHSLIIDNPQFIHRFMSHHHHHQDRYPPLSSFTITFHAIYDRHIFQTFSKEWEFLNGKLSKPNFLNFMPHRMDIRASCNDLLLVSRSWVWYWFTSDFYVCHPITKQYVHLPDIPEPKDSRVSVGYGLLCVPPSPTTTNIEFQVVQIILPDDSVPLTVTVFCSESGMWEERNFHYPFKINCNRRSINIVTCNGILYLLGGKNGSDIFYLDLLKEQCGVIDFPSSYSLHCRHSIGVVCVPGGEPELRLIQAISNPKKTCPHLNVWRLDHNNDGDIIWLSVHSKESKELANLRSKQRKNICQAFLHPTNSSLVFIFWDQSCFQFNLKTGKYKKIDEIMVPDNCNTESLLPFPMVFSYGTSYASLDC